MKLTFKFINHRWSLFCSIEWLFLIHMLKAWIEQKTSLSKQETFPADLPSDFIRTVTLLAFQSGGLKTWAALLALPDLHLPACIAGIRWDSLHYFMSQFLNINFLLHMQVNAHPVILFLWRPWPVQVTFIIHSRAKWNSSLLYIGLELALPHIENFCLTLFYFPNFELCIFSF